MLLTSTLAAVLGSLAIALNPAAAPAWQPDYATAFAQSSTSHKPLAVFIGRGTGGAACIVAKGLTADENKALAEKFVTLYVDSDTPEGKSLAASFQISEGLVISDATGTVQALKHEGGVTHDELAGYLTKYADAARAVTTTDMGGTLKPVAAPASVDAFGRYINLGGKSNCPTCRN